MIRDFHLTIGDICGDRTGLRVQVEDVDIYNRVHFSVIDDAEESTSQSRDMSYHVFVHRFTRIGHSPINHQAA